VLNRRHRQFPLQHTSAGPTFAGSVFCTIILLLLWTTAGFAQPSYFTDVPPSKVFYLATADLYTHGITSGCAGAPPNLSYCPDSPILREQMAAFIVRAWSYRIWGGAELFQTYAPPSQIAYFNDVPNSDYFFPYVQKLKELGITNGCTQTTFCPLQNLQNFAAAVFTARVRAIVDAGCISNCSYLVDSWGASSNSYFSDVSPGVDYYMWIQRSGDLGIFTGAYRSFDASDLPYPCSGNNYCEYNSTTRAQMAIYISTGVLYPSSPALQSGSLLHRHYRYDYYDSRLYNSRPIDSVDTEYLGLPYFFNWFYASANPPETPSGTYRTMDTTAGGAPTCRDTGPILPPHRSDPIYGAFDFYQWSNPWYSYGRGPFVNGGWLASTGELFSSRQFASTGLYAPTGFTVQAEFEGETRYNPTALNSYFLEAIYSSDRECDDGGTEYGWYRFVAANLPSTSQMDQPVNSMVFYYATDANCVFYYACFTSGGAYVPGINIDYTDRTGVTLNGPNNYGAYLFNYTAIRNGSFFYLTITDPHTYQAANCTVTLSTANGGRTTTGPCVNVPVPIQSWYPPSSATPLTYVQLATQSSTVFPPEYNWTPFGAGAAPPINVFPHYPNESGPGAYQAGLQGNSASVIYH